MTTKRTIADEAEAAAAEERRLGVTGYDRVSSLLIAMLISVGVSVVLLVALWLSARMVSTPTSPTVTFGRVGEGGGDRRASGGIEIDTPADEPAAGRDKTTSDVAKNLSTLGTAVADNAADLDAVARLGRKGKGKGENGGNGDGKGVGQRDGPVGDPVKKTMWYPRNWELVIPKGNTLEQYARQLDHFHIELGVIMPDNRIVYAYNLAKAKPDRKEIRNPSANEHRFYLVCQNGYLEQAESELLARAGIESEGRPILKFLPPETEQTLARLEREYNGASPKDIRRTRFGIKGSPGAYEFFVSDQPLKR
ncbi:MAG: hypothetical protein LLG00_02110 [Planctomycetaceae bacterium]|nr:hypothetical protein [Planctomycetaceae bacterium]